MKQILLFLALSLFLYSCNNTVKIQKNNSEASVNTDVNDLLPTNVIVYNEVNFNEQALPNWTLGVDSVYMQKLNEEVLQSNVQLYSSNVYYEPSSNLEMTDNDVRSNMVTNGLINSLYFIEKWSFNKAAYSFKKEIVSWSPVMEYYKEINGRVDSSKIIKKLLYDLKGESKGTEKLIASNIIYEISFDSERKTNECFNLEQFVHYIIDPVINGEIETQDFFDNSEKSILDIRKSLGYSVDSIETINSNTGESSIDVNITKENLLSVQAFIFTEDWVIDTKSFVIRKKIKSIAPVSTKIRTDENGDDYIVKKIIFKVNLN